MADLTMRLDPATGYVHLTSAGEYPIPPEVWDTLRADPYRAEYAAAHRGELRLSKTSAAGATEDLRAAGHRVTLTTGTRPRPTPTGARGPMQCDTCAMAYVTGMVVGPDELCRNSDPTNTIPDPMTGERLPMHAPHRLVLVPPP